MAAETQTASATGKMPLHTRILIGLGLGAVVGAIAQATLGAENKSLEWFVETIATPAGNIFLYLLFMIVVPLLFSALLLGVGELGDAARVGKIGLYSLLMTVVLSGTAVVLGVAAVNLTNPGKVISAERREQLVEKYGNEEQGKKNLEAAKKGAEDPPLLGVIPKNPFKEVNRALEGGLLPFMFFAIMFGIALASIPREQSAPVRAFFEGVFAASQKIIEYAMNYGPIAVFFLVFRATATLGTDVFVAVGAYVAIVLVCLAIHQFGTYSLVLKFIAKRSPAEFFRQMRTTMITAFATSSSNATLPTALKAATDEVKLPQDISSFVLTVGATANQNGTALFEGITILFFAQLFGVELSLAQQLTVMGLAIVGGIGTAGIPGGAWPMITTILVMYKVPEAAVGIVLGIDRILDMSRTVLNVTGDMTIAACVSKMAERDRNNRAGDAEASPA
ncbi:MAG: dicarboxylate/amino acid:cation symporter [Fimbriimonadaceae bacterium]|nr:dicarboxylate/amino acid:cation symporter [Fimbriimonadaceae bacterium]